MRIQNETFPSQINEYKMSCKNCNKLRKRIDAREDEIIFLLRELKYTENKTIGGMIQQFYDWVIKVSS